jgi:hypothetical protein
MVFPARMREQQEPQSVARRLHSFEWRRTGDSRAIYDAPRKSRTESAQRSSFVTVGQKKGGDGRSPLAEVQEEDGSRARFELATLRLTALNPNQSQVAGAE